MTGEWRNEQSLYVLETLQAHLRNAGYAGNKGAVVWEYEYVTGTQEKKSRADLVAFADSDRLDISTACIAVEQCTNEEFRESKLMNLRYLGAPVALLAFPAHVEIWPVAASSSKLEGEPNYLPYDSLNEYFAERRDELSPRSLLDAKRGVRQLSFIDIDSSLESFARETTRKILVERFTEAIAAIPETTRKLHPEAVSRLAIWVLAARILQDKLSRQNNPFADLRAIGNVVSLLETAQEFFPQYFDGVRDDIAEVGTEALDEFYDALGREISFRNLTNDMLAYFYEHTLVTEEMRRTLGVYYTPQKNVAERILERLPIESLPPEDRTIFDGTCGSGNLLLAAYDRLNELLPVQYSREEKHGYLTKHIWGLDIDPFACEVARLSLFLYDLPVGDSWKVQQGDVFQDNPIELFGQQPAVIIGNPPFKETRSAGKRRQRAAEVVDRYVQWLRPGGFLGVIVPVTFLQNESAEATRKRLLEHCDVLEIWHLPEGAIPGSAAATAVILAHKPTDKAPDALRNLSKIETWRLENGKLTPQSRSPYVASQERWCTDHHARMESSPFDHIWDKISLQFDTFAPRFCSIHNGVQVGKRLGKAI